MLVSIRTTFAILILSIYAHIAGANICSEVICPQGYADTKVCFAAPDVADSGFWLSHSASNACEDAEMHIVNSDADFDRVFKAVARSCKRISKLIFIGHGSPNFHGAGDLSRESVKKLEPYNCTMATNSRVKLEGCSTGRGCIGQLFMYRTAEALLPRGGEVLAPTAPAMAVLAVPPLTANLRERILKYSPHLKKKEEWFYQAAVPPYTRWKSPPPGESCAAEMKSAILKLKRKLDVAKRYDCRATNFFIEAINEAIGDYRQISSVPLIKRNTPLLLSLSNPSMDGFKWSHWAINMTSRKLDECMASKPRLSRDWPVGR